LTRTVHHRLGFDELVSAQPGFMRQASLALVEGATCESAAAMIFREAKGLAKTEGGLAYGV
jgi:hypothetical protein